MCLINSSWYPTAACSSNSLATFYLVGNCVSNVNSCLAPGVYQNLTGPVVYNNDIMVNSGGLQVTGSLCDGYPTLQPSRKPSKFPTTKRPIATKKPSQKPIPTTTHEPSSQPTSLPSFRPSARLITQSVEPTQQPTTTSTNEPSSQPTSLPSFRPSARLITQSVEPSRKPTKFPNTKRPITTKRPSQHPTTTDLPSSQPTSIPSMTSCK